jgi:hypothetical protein
MTISTTDPIGAAIRRVKYIGSVVTLPLKVFSQALPMCFLQQFDPAYAIIREPVASEQTPPMAFPQE